MLILMGIGKIVAFACLVIKSRRNMNIGKQTKVEKCRSLMLSASPIFFGYHYPINDIDPSLVPVFSTVEFTYFIVMFIVYHYVI